MLKVPSAPADLEDCKRRRGAKIGNENVKATIEGMRENVRRMLDTRARVLPAQAQREWRAQARARVLVASCEKVAKLLSAEPQK